MKITILSLMLLIGASTAAHLRGGRRTLSLQNNPAFPTRPRPNPFPGLPPRPTPKPMPKPCLANLINLAECKCGTTKVTLPNGCPATRCIPNCPTPAKPATPAPTTPAPTSRLSSTEPTLTPAPTSEFYKCFLKGGGWSYCRANPAAPSSPTPVALTDNHHQDQQYKDPVLVPEVPWSTVEACCPKTFSVLGKEGWCKVTARTCINFAGSSAVADSDPVTAKLVLKPQASVTLTAACDFAIEVEQLREVTVFQSGGVAVQAIIGYTINLESGLQGSVTFAADATLDVELESEPTVKVSGNGRVSPPTLSAAGLAANVKASAEVYVGVQASVLANTAAIGAKVVANAHAELSVDAKEGMDGVSDWGATITGYGQIEVPSFSVPSAVFCDAENDLGLDYSNDDLSIGGEVTIWEYTKPKTSPTSTVSTPQEYKYVDWKPIKGGTCARWAHLADDGNNKPQHQVNSKFAHGRPPAFTSFCDRPVNDKGTGPWCYLKGGGWSYCEEPKNIFSGVMSEKPAEKPDFGNPFENW